MNPGVVEAVKRLREGNILSEAQSSLFLRVARRELVSARMELRMALYTGVLLIASGVGIFLKENHERIGPTAIAVLIGAVAAVCFFYVFRRSPSFSWRPVVSPHLAVDYLLLLGVLLLASDLAYVEAQFKVLGPHWAYHLLVISLIYFAAAYRFDSRAVLSLALTSFAAWRGVSVNFPFESLLGGKSAVVRANALSCAALFLAGAVASVHWRRKAHFEPVWATLGLLLLFGGLLSGVFQGGGTAWLLWVVLLSPIAAAVIGVAYRKGRSLYFAIGVVAAYLGVLRLLWEPLGDAVAAYFVFTALSSLAVLVFLFFTHRRMKEVS